MGEAFPAGFLSRVYGIEVLAAERIAGGDEGVVWKVRSAAGRRWSVKRFRRLSLRDVHRRAALMDRLAGDGFPFPRVLRTVGGELAAEIGAAGVMVCEWLDGDTVDALSSRSGESAGAMLGKLHRALDRGADPVQQASQKSWEIDPPERAIATCRTIQRRVEALASPAELDRRIHDALGRRIALLSNPRLAHIRDEMPGLARQPIHGDYTRPNLLFADERVVGILDPLGRVGYRVWELGRIAFEPATIAARPDWRNVAAATIRGYRRELSLTRGEAAATARITMLYFAFSFWGVEARFPATGGAVPTRHEEYWLNRQMAAQLLFENLADLESLAGAAEM